MLAALPLDKLRTDQDANHRFDLDPVQLGELAASMKADGLINPVRVVRRADGWHLVAGFRRVAAARMLDWSHIDATFDPDAEGPTDSQRLAENLVRAELTPVEEAHAINTLFNDGAMPIEAIAARLNRRPDWIEHRIAMASYPEPVLKALHLRLIGVGVADELAQIVSPDQLLLLLDAASRSGCSKRQAALWRATANAAVTDPTANHQPSNAIPLAGPPPIVVKQCFSCERTHDVTGMTYVTICAECTAAIQHAAADQRAQPPGTT